MAGKRKPARGPDWGAIEAQYLAGAKPPDLAQQHGVKIETLRSRIKRGKWGEERAVVAPIVHRERTKRAIAVVADETAEWVRESLRMAREARAELWRAREGIQEKIVSSPDGPRVESLRFRNSPSDWRAFVAALDALDAVGRRALKLDEVAPPVIAEGAGLLIVPADSDDWRNLSVQSGTGSDEGPGDG